MREGMQKCIPVLGRELNLSVEPSTIGRLGS